MSSSEHSHRGSRSPGPMTQASDRRIMELDEALRGVEAMTGALPGLGFFRDSTRSAAAGKHSLGYSGNWSRGTVIHALPYVNWFKVQMGDGGGWIAACALSGGSLMPMGPKSLNMPGPNDDVLVFKPKGLNHGIIIGVLPPPISDGSVLCPDWVVQAGGSGLKREAGHKYPITGMYKHGGIIDWSNQRPLDQTPYERGWVTPTGLALTIDDDMIQARVNEMTGIWMTVYDNWLRVAGGQLLIESFVHEEDAGDDEGEARYFKGIAAYPWEALGMYSKGVTITQESSDKEVHYTGNKAKVDLQNADLQPIYRYQEYGGYLGQGHLRMVMKPAKDSGTQRYGDSGTPDTGLFMESIGADGDLTILSAKGIHIGKRSQIVQPKAVQLPQSKKGDDAATGNYKFSSESGGGSAHKVGDVRVTGQEKSMLRVAGVQDLIAYATNWKAVHPFHYHKGDYKTPNPSEMTGLTKDQESIDYGELENQSFVSDPEARKLKIDSRYGDVEYFERESFIRFYDDGSVHLAGGAGEEIVFLNGRVTVAGPAGLFLCPGTDLVMLAEQIILRAKGSVDISSSEHDVRIKAEKNLQCLAGNSQEGGILFESKGTGSTQQYKDKYGEDVKGNGIVFRAPGSTVAMLSKDIYLRTGGADLEEGDITLDASRGKRRCQIYAKEFHTYTTNAVSLNFGPVDESSTVNRTYYFSDKTAIFDTKLLLGGKLIGYNGGGGSPGIVVDGGVYGTKSFATSGTMADKKGMFLGKVPGSFAGTIQSACNAAAAAVEPIKQGSQTRHETTIVQKYYQTDQIGDDALIQILDFSFRDPPDSQKQYKTQQFKLPEARWQQFARFGLASGGTAWTEKAVTCQGTETYPWPGKQAWKDKPTLYQLDQLSMFDAGQGRDKDRPGPYENPQLGSMTPTVADGHYKLTRSGN